MLGVLFDMLGGIFNYYCDNYVDYMLCNLWEYGGLYMFVIVFGGGGMYLININIDGG